MNPFIFSSKTGKINQTREIVDQKWEQRSLLEGRKCPIYIHMYMCAWVYT